MSASIPGLPLPGGWIALGVIAIGIGVGVTIGLPTGLLVGAGGVLTVVILLIWASVQSLTGSTPLTLEEAVGFGAPSAEEERKQAVLRALKDLEYERSVGKISDADYRDLSARYRLEAKRLLQMLDRDLEPYRNEVAREMEQRLGRQAFEGALDDTDSKPAARMDSERPVDSSATRPTCPACGVGNDLDARFCKGCGAPLGGEAA
jgi:hypothetical protein